MRRGQGPVPTLVNGGGTGTSFDGVDTQERRGQKMRQGVRAGIINKTPANGNVEGPENGMEIDQELVPALIMNVSVRRQRRGTGSGC